MKATSLKTAAVIAGSISLLAGNAMAQSSTSGVVGYETLDFVGGFNYAGVRLHENPAASGTLETVTATTAVDDDVDLGALMDGSTFILEIEDGSGIIQEVTSSDGGTGLTVADLSGVTAPVSYTLRPASTLATIFGVDPTATSGFVGGFGGPGGADQVWFYNGAGFDQYYYDTLNGSWTTIGAGGGAGVVADATSVDMIYADSFVVNAAGPKSVVVTGDLKAVETEANLVGGFNFVGAVAPVGANLETAYGVDPTTTAGVNFVGGFGGPGGADQVWVYNGAGFDQYYYDTLNASWTTIGAGGGAGATVTASAVALPSGYVINAAGPKDVTQSVPSYYAGL